MYGVTCQLLRVRIVAMDFHGLRGQHFLDRKWPFLLPLLLRGLLLFRRPVHRRLPRLTDQRDNHHSSRVSSYRLTVAMKSQTSGWVSTGLARSAKQQTAEAIPPDRLQRPALSTSHTRRGVAGMSMWRAPVRRLSASTMALMTAGGAPTAPASPEPLTPSGLEVVGTLWVENAKFGRSPARGMA